MEFISLYGMWKNERHKMNVEQLERLKSMVLERMEIDHAYGMTLVEVDRRLQMKKAGMI